MVRGFYKRVHPDLMHGYTPEAIECNARSLKELNAYIDRLESVEVISGPYVSRSLQFFQPVLNRHGRIVERILRPSLLLLASIPPSADMLVKEDLSVGLIREIEEIMQQDKRFSNKSAETVKIEPIIKAAAPRTHAEVRAGLTSIWRSESLADDIRQSLFDSDRDRVEDARNYRAMLAYNKMVRSHAKLKNARTRAKRMKEAVASAEEILTSSPLSHLTEESSTKLKIIESGFHPDLVFMSPELDENQREEGIAHICGVNLSREEDSWLLENIWKAVRREKPPPVPIVLMSDYLASTDGGYLGIPFNFELSALCDFLEDNLEPVREARKDLLRNFMPV